MNKSEYDKQKLERERQANQQKRIRTLRRAVIVIVIVIVFGIGIYWWMQRSREAASDRKIYATNYTIIGREHVSEGARHTDYNSNPPTSGPHYDTPEPRGAYREPFADEVLVHNLEHGYVWISYRPDTSPEIVNTLESFAGFSKKIIVTPRKEDEKMIALAAWGWLDTFDSASPDRLSDEEKKRIDDFIDQFINKGPEPLGQ